MFFTMAEGSYCRFISISEAVTHATLERLNCLAQAITALNKTKWNESLSDGMTKMTATN